MVERVELEKEIRKNTAGKYDTSYIDERVIVNRLIFKLVILFFWALGFIMGAWLI